MGFQNTHRTSYITTMIWYEWDEMNEKDHLMCGENTWEHQGGNFLLIEPFGGENILLHRKSQMNISAVKLFWIEVVATEEYFNLFCFREAFEFRQYIIEFTVQNFLLINFRRQRNVQPFPFDHIHTKLCHCGQSYSCLHSDSFALPWACKADCLYIYNGDIWVALSLSSYFL